MAVRLLALAGSCWFIYSHAYAPASLRPLAEIAPTIRASNAGHSYQLYFGPSAEWRPADVKPTELVKYADFYGEYGIHLMVATTSVVGRAIWGDGFLINELTAPKAIGGLFFITALLFAHPALPLLASVVLQSLFALLLTEGSIHVGSSQLWGVQYAILLSGAVAVVAPMPKKSFRALSFLLVATLLLAFSRYLRQESAGIPIALVAALGVGVAILIGSARRTFSNSGEWRAFAITMAGRVGATIGAILITGFLLSSAVRAVYAVAWQTPYSETNEGKHGAGWPLYLGLGYASNPFNIGWNDVIGQIHVQMIAPGVPWTSGEAFQDALEVEWRRQIWTSPWLFAKQVQAKAQRLHQTLWSKSPAAGDQVLAQGAVAVWFYRGTLVGLPLLGLVVLAGRAAPAAFVSIFGLLGIIAGACAGPLIVHPGYITGPQGVALTALPMMLVALIVHTLHGGDVSGTVPVAQQRRWMLRAGATALATGVCAVLAVAAITGAQWLRYRAEVGRILASEPLAEIDRLGFRYGHLFNEFSSAQQLEVVKRLRATTDHRVTGVVAPTRGNATSFEAIVAIATPKELHLIVRLGSAVRPPAPRIFQGDTHSIVQLCLKCTATTGILTYDYSDTVWTMLNDHEWRDTLRFLSFPANLDVAGLQNLTAGAYRIVGLDARVPNTGWVAELIAEASMRFHDVPR